jgi:hypothetical protein
MHLVDVNLHLKLIMVAQKMVDIGYDIGESLEEKKMKIGTMNAM